MIRKPLNVPSLNAKVYETLWEMIINGDLAPGFRLQEYMLVNTLGTSKTPIKLALAKLEQDGLVKIIPRRGAYVITLSKDVAVEVYLLREVLEGLATRLAAQNLSNDDLRKLGSLFPKMEQEIEGSRYKNFVGYDEEFHEIIMKASNHSRLQEFLKSLLGFIKMFKFRSSTIAGRTMAANKEHIEIYKALENRDAFKAEEAMRYHIRQVMKDVVEKFNF